MVKKTPYLDHYGLLLALIYLYVSVMSILELFDSHSDELDHGFIESVVSINTCYKVADSDLLSLNPCPAEPGYILPLQSVDPDQLAFLKKLLKKPTDLDLHCLSLSM